MKLKYDNCVFNITPLAVGGGLNRFTEKDRVYDQLGRQYSFNINNPVSRACRGKGDRLFSFAFISQRDFEDM